MSRYRLSTDARADLRHIRDRILRERPSSTVNFIGGLTAVFDLLCDSPLIGRSRDEVETDLRSFVHGSYVAFYRVDPPDIEIVRVIHGRRDLTKIFEH